eukprot:2880730-Ditylum_brightwellii.AAC.1
MKFRSNHPQYFDVPTKPLLVSRDMELYRLLEYDVFTCSSPPPTAMIQSSTHCHGGVSVDDGTPPVLLTRL